MRDLLTASRMTCLQHCPRRHYWRYEVGLQRTEASDALRFGTAWHTAMEARALGKSCADCFAAAIAGKTLDEMQVATLSGLLAGYFTLYPADGWTVLPEQEFAFCLRRGRSAMWAAGKIDGIITMPRCMLLEHKTAGADIAADSDYWLRLRGNKQVMHYVTGAQSLGHDPACTLYDVVRKPMIRQKQGETVEEFGDRLTADCKERPEFYFARREVPILQDEMNAFALERGQLAAEIQWRRRSGAWPRNLGEMTCKGCEYASFCLQNIAVDLANPPAGFAVGEKNNELSEAVK